MGYQIGAMVENLGWEWKWGVLIAAGNVLVWWGFLMAGIKVKKGRKKYD